MRRSDIIMGMVTPQPTNVSTSRRYRRLTNVPLPENSPSSEPEQQNIPEEKHTFNGASISTTCSTDVNSINSNDGHRGTPQQCNYPQVAIEELESHSLTEGNINSPTCTLANNPITDLFNIPGTSTDKPWSDKFLYELAREPSLADDCLSKEIQVNDRLFAEPLIPTESTTDETGFLSGDKGISYTISNFDDDVTSNIIENADNAEGKTLTVLHEVSTSNSTNIINNNNMLDFSCNSQQNNSDDGLLPITTELPSLSDVPTHEDIRRKTRIRSATKIPKSAYCDFLGNDTEFEIEYSSSSWEGSSEEEDEEMPRKKKLKKNQKVWIAEDEVVGEAGCREKKINKAKERQTLYQKGKSYKKNDGTIVPEKEMRPNPCQGSACFNKCGDISEDKRISVFKHFWSLSPQRRRDWLVSLSKIENVKRKRVKDLSRKSKTFRYFINEGEGQRPVCLKFLLATLDITQRYLYYTLSNASCGLAKEDMRGKTIPANKTPDHILTSLKNFITSLPAVPSHYSRKDSTKVYLPQEFKNVSKLYQFYKSEQTKNGIDVVSERLFRNIFSRDFKIGFHVPKKDKCVKCIGFENNPGPENEALKKAHEKERDESKKRFEVHQKIHNKNNTILCTSFDLQKVLNTPHGESMLLYYSRKIAVYNLTFYESTTRKGYCFSWNENEGKRGANEIATIIKKYIADVDKRGTVRTLLLYCDSCPGQNKNRTILASLHHNLLSCSNLEVIQINYLLPGHTYMPVDSMHSVIEKSVSKHIIWAPSQWATVFELARSVPEPYVVHSLKHKDFLSWDNISDKYFKGNLVGKISKIRVATLRKTDMNKMVVKYSMATNAEEETISIVGKLKNNPSPELYKEPLPISKQKFQDLAKLCKANVIPVQYHNEYLNFSQGNTKDTLPETDEEDMSE